MLVCRHLPIAICLLFSQVAPAQNPPSPREIAEIRGLAEKGDPEAQYTLGTLYMGGAGVPLDEAEAVNWHRKAAAQGYADSQTELGAAYAQGAGVSKDEAMAVTWYRKAADQGDKVGLFFLGVMYASGRGAPKDQVEGYKWFLLSRAYGNEDAEKSVRFFERLLTPKEQEDGKKRAAEFKPSKKSSSGNSNANPPSNASIADVIASDWRLHGDIDGIRAAAERGDAKSQFLLSYRLSLGYGIQKDLDEAVTWCRKAADQGYAEAQAFYAAMLQFGEGVPRDRATAVEWYRKAADQGHVISQSALGEIYSQGDGVPKDPAEAYKWLVIAGEQGWKNAIVLLEKFKRTLSNEERTEGLRRIGEFHKNQRGLPRASNKPQ